MSPPAATDPERPDPLSCTGTNRTSSPYGSPGSTSATASTGPPAIATSGRSESADPTIRRLNVPEHVPVVTRDQVPHAKPDPDLFVEATARRARMLSVGFRSGGYGKEELERAGAYRVYEDPADLRRHLDEVGVRIPD